LRGMVGRQEKADLRFRIGDLRGEGRKVEVGKR
jgi:hypothetical protein